MGGEFTDTAGIWQELRSQRDLLIEMKVKLEAVPDHELRIRELEEVRDLIPDHELRLRRMEERRFPLQTVAVLVAVLSVLVTVVLFALNN
jgi:hypothetical protein